MTRPMSLHACPPCSRTLLRSVPSRAIQGCLRFQLPQPFVERQTPGVNTRQQHTAPNKRLKRSHKPICAATHEAGSANSPQPLRPLEELSTPTWDVVGLGQPMVDFSAAVQDDLLIRLGIAKGSRRVISAPQRAEVLQALESTPYQVSLGGSLSNTLIGLSRLGQADHSLRGSGGLQVGLAGAVGSDTLGSFFAAQAAKAGVAILADTLAKSCTGTAIVLTTPDANRTFLSYLGEKHAIELSAAAKQAISSSRMLVIEGYMWEVDNALETLSASAQFARENDAMVVLTAGDAGVVQRHTSDVWQLIHEGVDIFFCNRSEAAALLGRSNCTAEEAALALGPHCKVVLVTDGVHGSYISALGQLHQIPPCWTSTIPVDTCGAGDGYAAGALYGFLCGFDLMNVGRAGARVASAVILRSGATTTEEEALQLVQGMPDTTEAPHTPLLTKKDEVLMQKRIQCL